MTKLTNLKSLLVFAILIAAAFTVTGCARMKVTGGGKLDNGTTKSTFTVNANSCKSDADGNAVVKGNLTYVDKSAALAPNGGGLKLKGEITGAAECDALGDQVAFGCIICLFYGYDLYVTFDYTSTNPFYPGTGSGVVCATDNGEGSGSLPDNAAIALFGGVYGNYLNVGVIQGNIQQHECKAD